MIQKQPAAVKPAGPGLDEPGIRTRAGTPLLSSQLEQQWSYMSRSSLNRGGITRYLLVSGKISVFQQIYCYPIHLSKPVTVVQLKGITWLSLAVPAWLWNSNRCKSKTRMKIMCLIPNDPVIDSDVLARPIKMNLKPKMSNASILVKVFWLINFLSADALWAELVEETLRYWYLS